jgi:hypothetical protein
MTTPTDPTDADRDGGEPAETGDGFVTESWTYLGRRITRTDDTAVQVWLDAAGEEHRFGAGRGPNPVVGGIYQLPVHRNAATNSLRIQPGQARYRGRHDNPVHIGQWQAADITTATRLAEQRLEASARRRNTLDDALKPVLDIAAGLKAYADKDTLARYITRRIHQT